MDLHHVAAVLLAAGAAGWVDAVVGGGGLVLIPVLLLSYPGLAPATALGTNKLAAICGTATAAVTYARRTKINLKIAAGTGGLALVFAGLGAASASHLPTSLFRPMIMVLLLGVAGFVAFRPTFGVTQHSSDPGRGRRLAAILIAGCCIGFYDGIFGPGTGTFLILTFTSLLFLEFVQSSAMAKVVNAGTNLGALLVFVTQGHVLWLLGLCMALCNVVGARLGAGMALRRGSGFVRAILVTVVVVMVGKLVFDQFMAA